MRPQKRNRILSEPRRIQQDAAELAACLDAAERIAVLTGAGMSTESGIPDFRSSSGIYATVTSEEIFDLERFWQQPDKFYDFARTFFGDMWAAKPNAGHLVLAELEHDFGKQVDIATQNIDVLHQQAGSSRVHPVHGTIQTVSCLRCGAQRPTLETRPIFEAGDVPKCTCGCVWKPDIVFFGEVLPDRAVTDSVAAMRQADLVLVLGTSLAVYPAAALPGYRSGEAQLAIVNRTPTPLDREADAVCHESIGDVLQAAINILADGR
jgi:NAD-dependent deacetylase